MPPQSVQSARMQAQRLINKLMGKVYAPKWGQLQRLALGKEISERVGPKYCVRLGEGAAKRWKRNGQMLLNATLLREGESKDDYEKMMDTMWLLNLRYVRLRRRSVAVQRFGVALGLGDEVG